jgi:hypothetical protein
LCGGQLVLAKRRKKPNKIYDILETKWAKNLFKRLSKRERECFITKLSDFDILKDTKFSKEYLELHDMKCVICDSDGLCHIILLGLLEKKAKMMGVISDYLIDEIEKSVQINLNFEQPDIVETLKEVVNLFTKKYK